MSVVVYSYAQYCNDCGVRTKAYVHIIIDFHVLLYCTCYLFVLDDSTSIHVLDIDGLVEAKKSSSLMSIHVSYEHNYDIRVGV